MARHSNLNSHEKLAKACTTATRRIGSSTIGHLLNATGPQPRLDTIVAVAEAFKLSPWQLLHPDFDPVRKTASGVSSPELISIARRIEIMQEPQRELLLSIFQSSIDWQPGMPDRRRTSSASRSPRTSKQ